LTRAFLIAGAASVLATRWKVPENNDTRRFLGKFYALLRPDGSALGGKPVRKDEALQGAMRWAIAAKLPAQVWAAWVLIGDGGL
jgi:CHAT domain-containing protein